MIAHISKKANIKKIQDQYDAKVIEEKDYWVVVTSSKVKELDEEYAPFVMEKFPMDSDIQLASRNYINKTREVDLGNGVIIGGDSKNTALITGPCSVENEEQIDACAQFCVEQNIKILRAGCYKPRTSPYTFQGLGQKGLVLLAKMRDKYNLKIITEVKDTTHIHEIIEYADIIQIGAKAMYDHGVLSACSKIQKPVLIKRGFGSTLQEFVQSAEFVLSGGNSNVVLCERGIRTFETKTRFTLDLCGVAYLKNYTNLPIIVDPSHAMGYRYGVADLTRASLAMGVDGLLLETHPDPEKALSDASQQLSFPEFDLLNKTLYPIANAIGKNIV